MVAMVFKTRVRPGRSTTGLVWYDDVAGSGMVDDDNEDRCWA